MLQGACVTANIEAPPARFSTDPNVGVPGAVDGLVVERVSPLNTTAYYLHPAGY